MAKNFKLRLATLLAMFLILGIPGVSFAGETAVPLTKQEVLSILEDAVAETGDNCSCGLVISRRVRLFEGQLKSLKKERGWNTATYRVVNGWFGENADNPDLIKANNRQIYIDRYYKEFAALFTD